MNENNSSERMTVLVVEPGRKPYVKEIDTQLEDLQREVGGYIQAIYPYADIDCALICNEEGKLDGLPLNRVLRDENGKIYDVVAGTFIVAGLSEDSFASLDKEQIKKLSKLYETPEMFVKHNGRLTVIPLMEGPTKEKKPSVLAQLNSGKQAPIPAKKESHKLEER